MSDFTNLRHLTVINKFTENKDCSCGHGDAVCHHHGDVILQNPVPKPQRGTYHTDDAGDK
jgi:hypothetical protein